MQNNKLKRGSIAASDSINPTFTGGHVNYLDIQCDNTNVTTSELFIDVKLRGANVNTQIVERMAVGDLVGISAQENGQDAAASNVNRFRVQIGSIDLSDAQLIVTLENTDGSNACPYGLYAGCDNVAPDRILKYSKTESTSFVAKDALAIYAANLGDDDTLSFKYDNESFTTDGYGMKLASYVGGRFHDGSGLLIHKIFQNNTSLPVDVSLNLVAASASFYVIVVSEENIAVRVSKSTVKNAINLRNKIQALEMDDPQKALALRHQNRAVKSSQLTAAINSIGRGL